ncbi:hypothetical protein FALCPG4_002213 [Fusarium falciforme]
MPQITDSGLKVRRVWAFGNINSGTDQPVYFQFLDTAKKTITINTGANGIARLYATVATAEKHSIQLVLPMLNNWDDLGGINTYCAYFGCTHETFWTHAEAQQAYKDYVTFIVNRYKDSPAIFSWQLYNEALVSELRKRCDHWLGHRDIQFHQIAGPKPSCIVG